MRLTVPDAVEAARPSLVVAFLLAAALGLLSPTGAGAAELYGSVFDKGQPQREVEVILRPEGGQGPLIQRTDQRGVYRFRNIPPGIYEIEVMGVRHRIYVDPGPTRYDLRR